MKRSLILLASLGLSLASIRTADAQYRRNERVVIQMKIDSWTPHEGEVGSLVTLNGSGFTRKMEVLMGGHKVQIAQMGSRSLSFRVPAGYGDGQIVIRKSGMANDYSVGTFDVWSNPTVTGFSPASGTPGTKVEIRGQNFNQDDMVYLGSQALPIERWSENSLIVAIPQGAVSNYLNVKNKRNAEARSPRSFTVVAPAPYISSFSPLRGQPGTIVRISGGNYGDDISVAYGRQSVPIARTGNGWIEVAVPANADKSWPLSISSRRGGATASTYFDLELAPVLSSYTPAWGHVGSRVTLRGDHFLANDRVSISGQDCKIVELRDNQITIEVPPNAHSGAIAVHRASQQVALPNAFDVLYQPQLSGVAPLYGAPGTRVTVSGQHLDGSKIYLGNTEIRPSSIADGQIVLVIPERALSGSLRVATRGGEGSWAKPFDVWNYPSITGVSPSRGSIGSAVTISGTMLGNAKQVFLGNVEMPIMTRQSDDRIIVQVPKGATDGTISWTAYGKNTATTWRYDVLQAPVLSSYSPTEGAAGTTVNIAGSGFDGGTRVFYGNTPVRVLSWTANRLSVEIPQRADHSEYLRVQGIGGDVTAPNPFGLLRAPSLRKYSDYAAKPGAEITLWGDSLATDTIVNIGNNNLKVLRINPDGSIVVAVPAVAAGQYEVSVQSHGLRSVGRQRFAVQGWAEVSDISPRIAKIGDTIVLSGSGLADAQVWYGSHQLAVQRADRRGGKLWVTIPEGCAGSSPLTVVDGTNKSLTQVLLEIEAPAPPPNVRDHRDADKGKGPKVRDHRRGKRGY